MQIKYLTERGARELLGSVTEMRIPMQVRLRETEMREEQARIEAAALRKIEAHLEVLEESLRGHLQELTEDRT